MNLRRTRAVARKEFWHILRDPRSLSLALAMPMMMLLLFGYALSLDVDQIPTAVVDQDRTPQSRELLARFASSKYFKLVAFPEHLQDIERFILRGKVVLGIVIPSDYSRQLTSGRIAQVQLLLDGSDSNTASIAAGYADGVSQAYALETRQHFTNQRSGMTLPATVQTRLRVWYNSELESKNYIIPGLIAVILMIISAMLTSLTIAREWEMGTMEQILSTPLRPAELVLGKMSAYFALGLADALIAVAIGVLLFGVPLRGNLASALREHLHLSVRRSWLGHCHFGHRPVAAAGLPDGNHQLVSAGVSALRLCLLNRKHARGRAGRDVHFPGALFRHAAESHFSERHWSHLALE